MPPLRQEFSRANRQAYRPLPGLVGFHRLIEFSLDLHRLYAGVARPGPAYSL